MERLQPCDLMRGLRRLGLDDVTVGWLPVARRRTAWGGPVGLFEAPPGELEGPAEALLARAAAACWPAA